MFQNIPVMLGQYRPLNSYLHRLDARSKLLPVMLVLILSLISNSVYFYLAILAALVIGLLFTGIDGRTILNNFKPVLILVGVTSLYHLIFTGHKSEIVFQFGFIKLYQAGVEAAIFYSLRLIIFISIAFLITLTNSPSELGEALTKILKPLEKLHIPISDLALILFIALRFIPILYEEFVAIKNAQIIRGVKFSGNLKDKIKKTTAIIIPVFIAAIQRADDLALALEARGYGRSKVRTFYSRAHFGVNEIIFATLSSVGIILLFIWV